MLRHTVRGARLNRLQLLLCVTWGRSALAVCPHPRPVESAAGPPGAAAPRGGPLSSAILYVAIVAIWAGVLIPRWLRRDSSPSSSSEQAGDDLTTTEPDSAADEEPARRSRREAAPPLRTAGRTSGRPEARPEVRFEARADRRPQARPEVRLEARAERRPEARAERRPEARVEPRPEMAGVLREAPPRGEPRGSGRDQEHKRVLASRQRLLGLLLILVIGSGALAFTKLAAWWVVVPPSVMLLGYVALLREAAKADAGRRELARTSAVAGPLVRGVAHCGIAYSGAGADRSSRSGAGAGRSPGSGSRRGGHRHLRVPQAGRQGVLRPVRGRQAARGRRLSSRAGQALDPAAGVGGAALAPGLRRQWSIDAAG